MNDRTDEDRLDEIIRQAVDLGDLRFDRKKWLDRLSEPSLPGSENNRAPLGHPGNVWRTIMKSKTTRYSVAAVLALAAALVLLNAPGTLPYGVALAQVQARIAEVNTMVLRGETTFTSVSDPNIAVAYDNLKYLSRQAGFVEEGFVKGALIYRVILNTHQKQGLLLFPVWKKCVKFPCTEEQIRAVERLTPSGVVDLLLESEYKKLGPANIDGVDVEGFEVQDLKPLENIVPKFLLDLRQGKATIWVGTKELLPIRMEAVMLLGKSMATLFMDVECREIAVLERYNVELDAGLFDTRVPEGYTEFQINDFIPGKQ